MFKAVGLSALVLLGSWLPVAAKPLSNTSYKFYNISGDTPGEIYNAMIRRGPDVNGVNAYASTLATSSQSGRLIQGQSCQVTGYHFKIDFVINLPKLKNESALSGQTKIKWAQFKAFLKSHEEMHRTIWLGCSQNVEEKIKALHPKSCKSLDKEAAKLWQRARKSCDVKHQAWDAAAQRLLIRHPFIQLVLSNQIRATVALKTLKKRK